MTTIIIWTIVYSLSTALSITLLGQRDLISGNLLNLSNFMRLLFHWKFILSMMFAIISRLSFIMTNNAILKIPRLANASTTITAFITILSFFFIILANYIFLKERFNLTQVIGGIIILVGVMVILK